MSNPIESFLPVQPLAPLDKNPMEGIKPGEKGQGEFSSFLKDALTDLESKQVEAQQSALALAAGQTDDFHTPVIAMEKASLTLGLAVTVRNKVLDAYHEIMRMQI